MDIRSEDLQAKIDAGDQVDPAEVTACRAAYKSTVLKVKTAAIDRMHENFVEEAQKPSLCWELLNKLRSPQSTVNINTEDMCKHFEDVYFKQGHPPLLRLGHCLTIKIRK